MTALIAQALIQEIAPKTIKHHIEARDFLRAQESENPCGLLGALSTIYWNCSVDGDKFGNFELTEIIARESDNYYSVGKAEIRLLCLIAMRTIWQRHSHLVARSSEASETLTLLLHLMQKTVYMKVTDIAEEEQIITTVAAISRNLIPFGWRDLILFLIGGFQTMLSDASSMETKTFLKFALQFLTTQGSRRLGTAQKDLMVLFSDSPILAFIYATWIKCHRDWIIKRD